MGEEMIKSAMSLGRLQVLNEVADFIIDNTPKYPSSLEVFRALNDSLKEIKKRYGEKLNQE